LFQEYENTPNDGSIEKSDVLGILSKEFYLFDFDKLFKNIKPEYISFSFGSLSIQLSDNKHVFFNSAYEEFNQKLVP